MNFTDLLEEHRIEHYVGHGHHHCTEGWVQLDCPQCSPGSRRFRLGYNIAGKFCSCWTCGYVKLWEVVLEIVGDAQEAYKVVKQIPKEALERKKHTGTLRLPDGIGSLTKFHKEYLGSRGFDPRQIVSQWEVQGIGLCSDPKMRWRLFIPVHQNGEVVTWTTRSIRPDAAQRYWSANADDSLVSIHDCLYGVDHCRQSVVVCEGPTDAWAIGPGAVATCGQRVGQSQLSALSRIVSRAICFDAEPEAQRRARRLADDLSAFPGTTTNIIPETGKDPASASKEEIEAIRREFLE